MIPLNAFSTLTIHGLVFKDGVSIPQTFQKGISRSGRVRDFRDDYFIRPGGFPSRPPSILPPPKNENLSVSLGKTLGSGRIGTVHETTLLAHNASLPPLIVKVSRHKRSASIEQEAWFYEELEQIQGVALPRCYGLFQAHIEDGTEVLTWKKKRSSEYEEFNESEESNGSEEPNECENSSESSDYGNPRMHWDTEDSDGEIIPVFPPPDPTLITILLLERLGERMPLRESLDTIKSDIFEIYNDVSRLGVEHLDIRWSNILSVQDPDHQPPENVCPNHGHAHRWRIVDFDLARKTNVTIHGLVFKDGVSIPQTFQKGVSRSGRVCDFGGNYWIRPDGFPSRPPSNLPPPGNEYLSVSLGETLGSGRIGTVHQAVLDIDDLKLPPLIIKISRQKRSPHLQQEAWFYEELEQIQGVAVPRCYGLFQANIDDETEVLTWKKTRNNESEEFNDLEELNQSDEPSEGSDAGSESSDYGNPTLHWDTEDFIGEIVPVFPPPDPTLITILLLERLGGRMPIGEPLDTIESDIYEIYNDVSRLGIEHLDIRWSNLLSVQDPDHQPSENVCPNHGHAHRWRIVDFDLARKTNGKIDFLDGCAEGWLERLFMNLRMGNVIEPWE